jgi:glyoxylase-like metal-dependent hydrolase (beta-lactamase superfamily II)
MVNKTYTLVAPGVWGMKIVFVNIYMVATGPREWVLVDAGLKNGAGKIIRMAEELFGVNVPPSAIILTHGHFDHVGALQELLTKWPVNVYAHSLELPYLTGLSAYPPPDPTAGGGMMTALSFIYPKGPINITEYVHPLKKDGTIPDMPGWDCIQTPGHSPGHISLFRPEDRLLIAGDAFVNVKSESLLAVIAQKKELSGPPRYFTPNWLAAAMSVKKLRDLKPEIAATGHGPVIQGDELTQGLGDLANDFQRLAMPHHGRYVNEPAKTNRKGVQYLPPIPFKTALVCAAFVLSAVAVFGMVNKLKSR